jgi:hypothetical protein
MAISQWEAAIARKPPLPEGSTVGEDTVPMSVTELKRFHVIQQAMDKDGAPGTADPGGVSGA